MLETPSRPSTRRDQMRRQILDAAWEVARADGLAAISLRDLARRVGMRAPSLYTYLDGKDAIFDAMFADGQLQLAEAFADFPTSGPARRTLRDGAQRFLTFCADDPTRYLLMFQRPVPDFEPSPASYELAVTNLELSRDSLRSAGVDADRHLDLWTALLSGLAAQQLSNEPRGDRWLRLADEAVAMFCDHVGLPPDPEETP